MLPLEGKTVVVGVTGGIAVYKSCELVSRLRKAGAQVHVIMTHNACQFVQPLTFETLSNHPVVNDTFKREGTWEVEHVSLARKADLFVIAPATANIMAKMAHGIADDMLSTTLLATRAPVLIAPAMNTGMWEHAATQENLHTLLKRGVQTIGPEGGHLACGDSGMGRMSEAADIFSACERILLPKQDMKDLKVMITAGPTREKLDPVRFLTNRSSGKMGYALAETAVKRGAQVTLVTGPVRLSAPNGCRVISVESTEDLYRAVTENCEQQDILVQAAAPADYTPETVSDQKIKKQEGEQLILVLEETKDVAYAAGQLKKEGQIFVGFAAETEHVLENAQRKLIKKNLDLIAANDVSRKDAGFDVDTNQLTLISKEDSRTLPLLSKKETADRLWDRVMELKLS